MSVFTYDDLDLQQDIECSSVSELKHVRSDELTNECLMLVSVPGYNTETGYTSKFLRLDDLVEKLRTIFNMPHNDYWLVNPNGFKQLHVSNGRVSDWSSDSQNTTYQLVDMKDTTQRYNVVNGQLLDQGNTHL